MSESQQMIVEMMCRAATADSFAYTEAIQAEVLTANVKERGVTMHYWSDEMLNAFRSAWEEVATELASNSAMFKEAYSDLSAFRETYNLWEANAFLPRAKR